MGKLVVYYNNLEASSTPVRKVLSAVRHMYAATAEYVPVNVKHKVKKDYLKDTKVCIVVGTAMIEYFLGKGVAGRNAAIQKDGVWFLTLPNISALYMKEVAIRAAKQVLRAIRILENPEYKVPSIQYVVVDSILKLAMVVGEAVKSDFVSFDFETNNELQPHSPTFRITCLGIMFNPNVCFVVPDMVLYNPDAVDYLQTLFQAKDTVKIAHNLGFDIKLLMKLGVTPKGQYACTKLMSFLVDENSPNGLKDFVDQYLPEYSGYDYSINFTTDTALDLYKYLAVDCYATFYAYCTFLQILVKDELLYEAFRNLYIPGAMVLKDLEYYGCDIDIPYLEDRMPALEKVITEREAELQEMPEVKGFVIARNEQLVDEKIMELESKIAERKIKFTNPQDWYLIDWRRQINEYRTGQRVCMDSCDFGSTKVLGELLYSDIGFGFPKPVVIERTAGGKKIKRETLSTDKEALNDIDHPIAEKLRIIRTFKMMLNTFYTSIYKKTIGGRLYSGFNQTGTVTGRLSSNNPNLQNLPTRTPIQDDELKMYIKGVKKAFIPPPGYVVMQADLSQAELRVIAHYSMDDNMINAYLKNIDLHAITGSRIAKMQDDFEGFLKSPDFKSYRTVAKSANFGLVYGIGADSYIDYVKNMTGNKITPADEKVHRASVFSAYPKLTEWHTKTELEVKANGFVRTIFGVRRNLPGVFSSDRKESSDAIRYAINSPIQGSIGGYAVWLMVWLRHRLPKEVRIINTVHDSIVFVVPETMVKEVAQVIKNTEHDIPFAGYFAAKPLVVPLKIDIEVGKNYGSLEEYDPEYEELHQKVLNLQNN